MAQQKPFFGHGEGINARDHQSPLRREESMNMAQHKPFFGHGEGMNATTN